MSPFQGEEASPILVTRSNKKDDSKESFFLFEIGKAKTEFFKSRFWRRRVANQAKHDAPA